MIFLKKRSKRLKLFVQVDLHKWMDNPFAKGETPPKK